LELGALLRLADADALTPADIRRLLPHVTARPPAGMPTEEASLERRLVASWADNLPIPARDGDWLLVVEELLKDTVDIGTPATWPTRPRADARTPSAGRSPN
jgi:hypothetical protein